MWGVCFQSWFCVYVCKCVFSEGNTCNIFGIGTKTLHIVGIFVYSNNISVKTDETLGAPCLIRELDAWRGWTRGGYLFLILWCFDYFGWML